MFHKGKISLKIENGKYNSFFHPPGHLRVLRRGISFNAYPSDTGGGLRGGDQLDLQIDLGPDSSLSWLPPASTLCYPGMNAEDAVGLDAQIRLAENADLFLVEPAFIPCAQSRIKREVVINIADSSSIFYFDVFSPGRVGYGEEWVFEEYLFNLKFYINSKPLLFEKFKITKDDYPSGKAGFQGAKLWATVLLKGKEYLSFIENYLKDFGRGTYWTKGELGQDVWNIKILDFAGTYLSRLPKKVT